jgi:L-seryl-tRNA(Ser) seleniumtransferase
MLAMTLDEIDRRARDLSERLGGIRGVRAALVDGASTTGGGSAPASALPTRLVRVTVDGLRAAALEEALRRGATPVVGRVQNDAVVLDLRTVGPDEIDGLVEAVRAAAARLDP